MDRDHAYLSPKDRARIAQRWLGGPYHPKEERQLSLHASMFLQQSEDDEPESDGVEAELEVQQSSRGTRDFHTIMSKKKLLWLNLFNFLPQWMENAGQSRVQSQFQETSPNT